jgi:hypothetical protein
MAVSHGLEAAQPTAAATCRDVRLSMTDQNKCDTEVKSATNESVRQQVVAQYQSKAALNGKSATTPSATAPAAPTTPGVDTTLPSTVPPSSSATPHPSAPVSPD